MLRIEFPVQLAYAGDVHVFRMLLEKQLALHASRAAHERHRAIGQMRQYPRRNPLVIARERELGATRALVDDSLRMSDRDPCHGFVANLYSRHSLARQR